MVYYKPRASVTISNEEQGPPAYDIQWSMKQTEYLHCPGEITTASPYEISM